MHSFTFTFTLRVTALIAAVMILAAASSVEAKGCARCRLAAGWGLASKPASSFDPDAMVSLKGEVISVQDVDKDKDLVAGEYLLITANDEQWPVRLAPTSYLKKEGIVFEPFDEIQVSGCTVSCGDKTGIIATEVHHGSKKLRFRDNKGKPMWAGPE